LILAGEFVAFTGKLSTLSRKQANELITRLGGTPVDAVSTRTTLLVVGSEGSSQPDRSHKLKKARLINDENPDRIRILDEDAFCRLTGLPAPSDLRQQYYALSDILAMYPTLREDQLRGLQKWQLIRPVVHTHTETYFAFPDLPIIRHVAAELERGVRLGVILRALQALRHGQLTFDFRLDAEPARIVRLAPPSIPPNVSVADTTAAERHFLAASALDGGDPARQEDAAREYRRALEADPTLVPALVNLANIHYAREDLVEAEALYVRAISIAPAVFEAHFNLGNVYHDVGRLDEAEHCYHEALRLNPDYADGHFYLAVTLEKLGRSPEAKPHWRAYQRLAPDGEWVELAREFSE
jgi:tetratricopeptide (TPR) repeat protein